MSAQGLGFMGMSQSYGEADEVTSIETLNRALELGVTFWDTATSTATPARAVSAPTNVSGYLSTLPAPGKPRVVGTDDDWLAFDPTNDQWVNDRYVTRLGP